METVIPLDIDTHDNTMMSDYSYCERLYALVHVLHRKSIGTKPALSFGGLVHVGLDALYRFFKNRDDNGLPRDAAEALAYAWHRMDLAVNGGTDEEGNEVLPTFEDPIDDFRTAERAKTLLLKYVEKYQEDTDFSRIIFTETAHDVHFPDGFKWGGIVDLWPEAHGAYWIVDHKTTSQFGQYYYDDFKRSPQMLGYMLTGAALQGSWPAGVIINVLVNRKTGIEIPDRKYLPFEEWLIEECRQMQIVNYNRIGAQCEHMEFVVSTGKLTSIQAAFDPRIWRPNLYNCVGKYGRCSMYDVCQSRPENRERVIELETEERQWDWRTVRD